MATILPCGHEVLDVAQPHYCSYISLATLMSLAKPNAESEHVRDYLHPDEHQFVVIHQICELSFMCGIFELRRVIAEVRSDEFSLARELLKRVQYYVEHARVSMTLLRTMRKENFAKFRSALAPASGAESENYRILELLSGIRPNSWYVKKWNPENPDREDPKRYKEFLNRAPSEGINVPKTRWWTQKMEDVVAEPNLASEFSSAMQRHNVASIGSLFEEEEHLELKKLANALYSYEQTFVGFRSLHEKGGGKAKGSPQLGHAKVAEAQIGSKPGTGHTSGVPYLQSVAETARFFPELWEYKQQNKAVPQGAWED